MVDIFNVTSAIIVPALSLLVTAIGMRYEIKQRDRSLCGEQRSREEQLRDEIIVERNNRHEEVLQLILQDVNRLKDGLDELEDSISELSKNQELLKYDLTIIKERLNRTDRIVENTEREISSILGTMSNLRYRNE